MSGPEFELCWKDGEFPILELIYVVVPLKPESANLSAGASLSCSALLLREGPFSCSQFGKGGDAHFLCVCLLILSTCIRIVVEY